MDETEIMTTNEEIANAVLHGVGLGLSIAVLVALVILGRIHGNILYIHQFRPEMQ